MMELTIELAPWQRELLSDEFTVASAIHTALQKPEVKVENRSDAKAIEAAANRVCPEAAAVIRKELFTYDLWARQYEPHYAHLAPQP